MFAQKFPGVAGIVFTDGDGVDDPSIEFTARLSQINALLDGMVFTPDAGFNGTATLQIVVDDQGFSGAGGVLTDDDTIKLQFNNAPTLINSGDLTLTAINEDDVTNTGNLVSEIIASDGGNPITDSNASPAEGIAVTAVDNSYGSWEYSTDGGSIWTAFGSVSDSAAVVLGDGVNDRIRFVPAANYNGSVTPGITFRAWDTTDGNASGTTGVNVTVNGGYTAYSSATETADIVVNSVNDAPLLGNGTLDAVDEDTPDPAGDTVANIFTGQFSDVDTAPSLAGVAIIGNTADPVAEGSWQYSTNAGSDWFDVGTVDDDATALVLSDVTLVRFVPVDDYNGTPTALSVRGLDNSYAGAYSSTAGSETRVNVDASVNGDDTAIAAASAELATSIGAVNDAPVNNIPGIQYTDTNTALVFDAINGNLISLSDVDAGAGALEVTLTATDGRLTLSGTTGLSFSVGDGSNDYDMTFTGTLADINSALDGLYFDPDTLFSGTATLQIVADDKGNTGGGDLVDTDLINIEVGFYNEAPVITAPAAQGMVEDTALVFSSGNGNAISIADVDAAGDDIEVKLAVGYGTLTLGGVRWPELQHGRRHGRPDDGV